MRSKYKHYSPIIPYWGNRNMKYVRRNNKIYYCYNNKCWKIILKEKPVVEEVPREEVERKAREAREKLRREIRRIREVERKIEKLIDELMEIV